MKEQKKTNKKSMDRWNRKAQGRKRNTYLFHLYYIFFCIFFIYIFFLKQFFIWNVRYKIPLNYMERINDILLPPYFCKTLFSNFNYPWRKVMWRGKDMKNERVFERYIWKVLFLKLKDIFVFFFSFRYEQFIL